MEGTRLRAALVARAQLLLHMHALIGAALPPDGLQALMRHLGLAKVLHCTPHTWVYSVYSSMLCDVIQPMQQLRVASCLPAREQLQCEVHDWQDFQVALSPC